MYASSAVQLSESQRQLIEVWGRLAYSWGVGPTMAQIFALLYVYPEPLDSDAILETLQISRGNVSINLRKLLEWGLIHKIEIPSSRRALYTAERDIWVIASQIIRKRFEREIVPISDLLAKLREREDVQKSPHTAKAIQQIEEVVSAIFLVTQLALPLLVRADRERFLKLLTHWQKRFHDAASIPGSLSGSSGEAGGDAQPS